MSRDDARLSRTRAASVTGLAVVFLGCGEPLPEPFWEGETIVLAAEEPDRVCGGTAEYMDRRAGELFEKLGTDPVQVEFYLLNDVDEYCSDDVGAVGCAVGSVVYSEWVPHPLPGTATRERMGELLTHDIDSLESSDEYGRAAHFIAFLDEQFGWESIQMLDTMLTEESNAAEIDIARFYLPVALAPANVGIRIDG